MKRRTDMRERDDAVSPVIGVMLMLVVTIIIAAVVSGFAGGLMTSREPAPSANFDVSMTADSLELVVRSASEDIPSKDIMIVLSKGNLWRKLVPKSSEVPFGFNIVERESTGFHDSYNVSEARKEDSVVSGTSAAHESNMVQWFGNYTLKAGSRMSASGDAFIDLHGNLKVPEGFDTVPSFTKGTFCDDITGDQWKSIFGEDVYKTDHGAESHVLKLNKGFTVNGDLGEYLEDKGFATKEGEGASAVYKTSSAIWAVAQDQNWSFGQTITYGDGLGGISELLPGDRVTVTIVHTPSGQTMFTKTVTVKGA